MEEIYLRDGLEKHFVSLGKFLDILKERYVDPKVSGHKEWDQKGASSIQ